MPLRTAASVAFAIISSVSRPGLTSRGTTPEYSAVRRSTSGCGLAAMIGIGGLALLQRRAVVPDSVKAMMTRASSSVAVEAAACAIALPTWPGSRQNWRARSKAGCFCAAWQIRAIARSASTGCAPTDVSCESITASVPSQIAFATSEASARVGPLEVTIDSSISVAVMTGTPARLARSITPFCTAGSSPSFSSTPRSPRATITASATSRIPPRLRIASSFSSLAIAGTQSLHELDVAHLDLVVGGTASRDEGDPTSAHQPLKRAVHRPRPDLGTLQVAEQRDGAAGILGSLPHSPRGRPVRVHVPMREVEPGDVHPGLDHRPQH